MSNGAPVLATAPSIALFRTAIAQQNEARWDEAAAAFRVLAEQNPGNLEIWCRLAACHEARRAWNEADAAYAKATQLRPDFAELRCNHGMVLLRLERWADAFAEFRAALERKENFAEAWNGQGVAQKNLGQLDPAAESFRRAIALKPSYSDFHYNLGNVQQAQEKFADAIASYRAALTHTPGSVEIRYNLACALCGAGDFAAARPTLEKILAENPEHAGAWNQLGSALLAADESVSAKNAFQRALALRPGFLEARCNLGNAHLAENELEHALSQYGAAQAISPDFPAARFNTAIVQLLRGEYRTGFENYEARWETEQKSHQRAWPVPLWDGSQAIAGKTILVHAEQGIGDTLQFARYVPLLSALGARVLLEVQPALIPLLRELVGCSGVFAKHAALPEFGLHCPMLSLPRAFRTELDSIPREVPYLHAPSEAQNRWREKLHRRAGPKIGLVVSGNAKHKNDARRSIALEKFAPLVRASDERGASWYLVQKDLRASDVASLPQLPTLENLAADLHDFAETAGVLANLDLLISVDTSVAHLAGALGRPVWLLLPFAPDWRWGLERDDSPWYPTMKLFRQRRAGDWEGVLAAISEQLARM